MFSRTAALFSAILGDTTRTLATRQIRIQPSRPLRKLAERRAVLGALQKYGDVVTFKAESSEYTNIHAIFDTSEAARKAIEASPLQISLLSDGGTEENINPAGNQQEAAAVVCDISQSQIDHYNHFIRSNPYYGPWTLDYSDERVSDVANTRAPRHEFADCFPVTKGQTAAATAAAGQLLDRDKYGVDRDLNEFPDEGPARSLDEVLEKKDPETDS